LDRQGIHVGPKGDDRRTCSDISYHARLGDPGLVVDAQFVQRFGDELGGLVFLKREFGMLVDVTPPSDDLIENVSRAFEHVSVLSLVGVE
jgi:hypothetical protein